ncbi:nucleotide exchange factor GrpE [Salana multivorans]
MSNDSQHDPVETPETGERGEPTAPAAADGTEPSAAAAAGAGADALGTDAGSSTDEVDGIRAEVLDLQDQLARAKADAYNVDQRFNAFVKRSRELEAQAREAGRSDVVEALVTVLDDIELARQHGELTGPFLAIADKLEQVLTTRFGVERYGQSGDEFDPALHEALMHADDPDASVATVSMVAQPGYRRGDQVIRPARVGVAGPA